MAKKNAAALRAARMKRIAARKNASAPGAQSNSVSSNKPAKNAPPPAVPSTLTTPVVDPALVPKTAHLDLLLFGAEQENPHWVVMASGRPVAEIRLEDQEEHEKIAKLFVTEKYAEGIREASKQFDLSEVLAGVSARSYIATVSGSDAYKQVQKEVTASATSQLRRAKADLRDDALNMLNLVVLAQTKNFIQENPLKAELFQRMTTAGIDEQQAVSVIEASYQAKASDHFDQCFKQAFKWMDLQPEALSELEEQIKGLNTRTPTVAASNSIPSASRIHNVPLETRPTTAAFNTEGDERSSMREALGLRARH